MQRIFATLIGTATMAIVACAGDITIDADETIGKQAAIDGPTLEFDPGADVPVLPFPHNLAINPLTGKLQLPKQCAETAGTVGAAGATATREALNQLDGFATRQAPIRITFSEKVSTKNLDTQHIKIFKRKRGATPTDPATAVAIPIMILGPGITLRDNKDCSGLPDQVNAVTVVPMVPLDGASTYTVVVLKGLQTDADGTEFIPSFTWSLVRQSANPVLVIDGELIEHTTPIQAIDPKTRAIDSVAVAKLIGIDGLWKAHQSALAFVDVALNQDPALDPVTRSDILLAWDFNTQTITEPLDPTVAGTPAAAAATTPLANVTTLLPNGVTPTQYIDGALGAGTCTTMNTCGAVGDIFGGKLDAANYLQKIPLPSSLTTAWDDPLLPTKQSDARLNFIGMIPDASVATAPYKTVVFFHGITRSKGDLLAIGSQLAAAGFASIAIDAVYHGSRAVQVVVNGLIGCPAGLDPSTQASENPQCFQSVFSADLAGTRDNFRQSILDNLRLVKALTACGPGTSCGVLEVDSNNIFVLGQSMGSFFASMVAAVSPDINAAVLNVPGGGWVDIVENTSRLDFRCQFVDLLIGEGIITGDVSNMQAQMLLAQLPTTGTCVVPSEFDALKLTPKWLTFAATARWLLGPGDQINYATRLRGKSVLIQEVLDDQLVANRTSKSFAELAGFDMPTAADVNTGSPLPSAGVIPTQGNPGRWLLYGGDPNNLFHHGSLLKPADSTANASAGTAQMQTDAITFLISHSLPL